MKRVVRVKLVPDAAQSEALDLTLRTCNAAANHAATVAYAHRKKAGRFPTQYDLHHQVYRELRANFNLSSQHAIRVISKVTDANKTFLANLLAGRYGKAGTRRREKVESKPVSFRAHAAHAFDDRCLSWNHTTKTVSISTLRGRVKGIPFVGRDVDLEVLKDHRQGESDLLFEDGKWYLVATVDVPTPQVSEPNGFVGVDLGIANIATTATDTGDELERWSGGAVTARRKRNQRLRKKLQAKGTKSAKRLLRKRSKKESRFVANVNHVVAKKIVTEAQRTGRGIAIEDLTGIRERARLRKPQQVTLHSWAFAQLGQFLTYKAQAAGVALVDVDPAYTSQTCSGCGYVDKKNRVNQAEFACRDCGVLLHADHNAAVNIAKRGVDRWAAINQPAGENPASRGRERRTQRRPRAANLAL